jgi:hypothetical protein
MAMRAMSNAHETSPKLLVFGEMVQEMPRIKGNVTVK